MVRWCPFFGQVVKVGLPDEKNGPHDGQAEAASAKFKARVALEALRVS